MNRRFGRGALAALALVAIDLRAARASTPEELFAKANSFYEEGRFEEAADTYGTILKYGLKDPRVLYNLGNASFKLGRLGPAILNYERALRIDPSDLEARDNLQLARARIRDRAPEAEIPFPIAAIQGALQILAPDRMAVLFLIAWGAASALGGSFLLARTETRRRVFGYLLLGGAILVLLAGLGLFVTVRMNLEPVGIVMQDRVDVRSGPAEDNTILFTVHEGTRLQLHGRREGWFQVSLPNALSGWIPSASVEAV